MLAPTLQLPRLVAGRDYADEIVRSIGLADDADVVVDGTRLLSGTASFAAELVEQLLVEHRARSLTLVGAPGDFVTYASTAARDLGVADRLSIVSEFPATI
jgi:hypothetical protein